jgi:hypothetical protein
MITVEKALRTWPPPLLDQPKLCSPDQEQVLGLATHPYVNVMKAIQDLSATLSHSAVNCMC